MSWDGTHMSLSKDSPKNYMYKNTVFLLDEISENSCAYLIGDLTEFVMNKQIEDKPLPLNFIINSPGGDVTIMMTILGLINIAKINQIQVNTFVMGIAASAASVIAVQGDVRKMTNVSRHFVHFGTMWSVTERYSEIEKIYEQTKDYAKRIDDLYLQACPNLTPTLLRDLQLDERGYLTAEQCVKYGLCDYIIENDLKRVQDITKKSNDFEKLFNLYCQSDYKGLYKKITDLEKNENKLLNISKKNSSK